MLKHVIYEVRIVWELTIGAGKFLSFVAFITFFINYNMILQEIVSNERTEYIDRIHVI